MSRFGADRGEDSSRPKRARTAVRLLLGHHKRNYWLTLAEAQVLLAELTLAVRQAERSAALSPPEPPTASAAALPAAA